MLLALLSTVPILYIISAFASSLQHSINCPIYQLGFCCDTFVSLLGLSGTQFDLLKSSGAKPVVDDQWIFPGAKTLGFGCEPYAGSCDKNTLCCNGKLYDGIGINCRGLH